MNTPMPKPWDQLPTEDDASYARFLVYRNLGLKRSLKRAYASTLADANLYSGDHRKLHLPANWRGDSSAHRWVERASSWDLHHLALHGSRVALLHVRAVELIARKAAAAAVRLKPGDEGWDDVLDSMRFVGTFLTPDVLAAIHERLAKEGHVAMPAAEPTPEGPMVDPDE